MDVLKINDDDVKTDKKIPKKSKIPNFEQNKKIPIMGIFQLWMWMKFVAGTVARLHAWHRGTAPRLAPWHSSLLALWHGSTPGTVAQLTPCEFQVWKGANELQASYYNYISFIRHQARKINNVKYKIRMINWIMKTKCTFGVLPD